MVNFSSISFIFWSSLSLKFVTRFFRVRVDSLWVLCDVSINLDVESVSGQMILVLGLVQGCQLWFSFV